MSSPGGSQPIAKSTFEGTNHGEQIGQINNFGTQSDARSIIDWLSPLDFNQKQDDVFAKRQSGTGEWFLDSAEFEDWESGSRQVLWCHGIQGSGKTVLVSLAVDYLCHKFSDSADVGVAWVYCQYKDRELQTPQNLLASLWRQLIDATKDLPEEVLELRRRRAKNNTHATLSEIVSILKTHISRFSVVYLFVDAYDECSENNGNSISLTLELEELLGADLPQNSDIRLLVTSRTDQSSITRSSIANINASDLDIAHVVSKRIAKGISNHRAISSQVRQNPELKKEIVKKIVAKSAGMFLMTQLILDSLKFQPSQNYLRDTLEALPDGLEGLYSEAWARIQDQPSPLPVVAVNILRWLVFSFRQLTLRELSHAMAVRKGQRSWDEAGLVPNDVLITICRGFVEVDAASGIVRLAHYTTQEYLEDNKARYFPGAHIDLAAISITYLSFETFAKGPCQFREDSGWNLQNQRGPIKKGRIYTIRLKRFPFLRYASLHWGNHVRESSEEANQEAVLAFLNSPQLLASSIQARNDGHSVKEVIGDANFEILKVAVLFGLRNLVHKLLDGTVGLLVMKDGAQSAFLLERAAIYGRLDIVDILLKAGANISLEAAIPLKHSFVYEHIMKQTPEVEITEKALQQAIRGRVVPVVVKYIEQSLSYGATRQRLITVLELLIEMNQLEMARLALRMGVDCRQIDDHGRKMISMAVKRNQLSVTELLIGSGADARAKNAEGETAAFEAVNEGFLEIATFLISQDARYITRNSQGQDLLGTAVASQSLFRRRLSWIRDFGRDRDLDKGESYARSKVLERDERTNVRAVLSSKLTDAADLHDLLLDKAFLNALHEDSEQQEIIAMLLRNGANINSVTPQGETLLHLGIGSEHRLTQLWEFSNQSLDINARDRQGRTPLHHALAASSIPGVRFLLRHNADIHIKDIRGAGALHYAVYSIACVKRMVKRRIGVNDTDNLGRTPLHYWAMFNCMDRRICDQLVKAGADDVAVDKHGLKANDIESCHVDEHGYSEIYSFMESAQMHRYRLADRVIWFALDDSGVQVQKEGINFYAQMEKEFKESKEWYLVSDDEDSGSEATDTEKAKNVEAANMSEEETQRRIEDEQHLAADNKEPSRNKPCWCGSKSKYKKCHAKWKS